MIRLTKLNQNEFVINADLIELMEETPDVVITLTTGRKFPVVETSDEIVKRIVDFRARVHAQALVEAQNHQRIV